MKNNKFIKGVNIIARSIPKEHQESFDIHAEHDQIWFGGADWPSIEDQEELESLGWFIDEDSWSCFT